MFTALHAARTDRIETDSEVQTLKFSQYGSDDRRNKPAKLKNRDFSGEYLLLKLKLM